MRVSPVCRDAHSRGVTADEAKVDRQPRDRQRRKDKEAGEEQEGEKTELATITKAGGLKGAKLSIRSRAGSETDSIAYFWPFAALREVTSMQEDPSPIRFHPSMPALFIPLGYAAGVGWNHVPSFAY
jgi:hypothetical protein